MKYICKQMNPAYQESPLFRDRDIWDDMYDRLYLVPADHCIGIHNDNLMDIINNIYNMAEEYDDICANKAYYYTSVTEMLNDMMPRYNGGKWNTMEVHKWKDILSNWDEDDTSVMCRMLDLAFGGNWQGREIHGCCQGDWALVYYDSEAYRKESIDYLEIEYFNLGEEWCCSCDPMTDEEAEDAEAEDADRGDCVYTYVYGWREEDKRKELAETIGCNAEEIVMFEYTGEASYSTYNKV